MQFEPSASFPFDDTANSNLWQDEFLRLKARLDAAEKLRLSGHSGFTLEESRRRLAAVCHREEL